MLKAATAELACDDDEQVDVMMPGAELQASKPSAGSQTAQVFIAIRQSDEGVERTLAADSPLCAYLDRSPLKWLRDQLDLICSKPGMRLIPVGRAPFSKEEKLAMTRALLGLAGALALMAAPALSQTTAQHIQAAKEHAAKTHEHAAAAERATGAKAAEHHRMAAKNHRQAAEHHTRAAAHHAAKKAATPSR